MIIIEYKTTIIKFHVLNIEKNILSKKKSRKINTMLG